MYPTQHAAATVLAILPLARGGWRGRDLVGFAAGAVLVDADHYLSYALRKGDPSLERAYCYHRERAGGDRGQKWALRPHVPPLLVDRQRPLHALAALGCLALAAWPWPALRPIAWGVAFHRLLDYAWESVRVPARRAG